ncbi:transmembrane channel-like protein 7 [Bombyx mori]|uniref:TMC domain-containing protein n=1 Tax=Bombyx mori TaxID=7091 RepID=A0A8R2R0K0_BOMMO|nr:transmembrane channel-like protein 7 [Bombyx mori]XP_037872762.1 transmembrane channel-like protein 7 [Bombyx mori]XP_037872763.1 transmembrane channel-like protein 7 [Bombyx mori]
MDDEIEVDPRPLSSRRSFTLRNSAARQVAVNFMPSRQIPYNTLRLRRNNTENNALLTDVAEAADEADNADVQANIIVREMEQHHQLMEDTPDAEELRREALRELPQGLTMKRNVRAKLSASVSLRSKRKPISLWKRFKYRMSFGWKRTKDRMRDLVFSIELWYEAIRNIEGHFGSAVGSYFYLVRWLFTMNLLLSGMVILFVVVPQVLHDKPDKTVNFGFWDFISGQGWLEDSLLFYAHYHDGAVVTAGLSYYMPFAYFFTMVCLYLTCFAVLCYRTAYSYRRNFIETGGGVTLIFANKVFCGWDFGIVSHKAAEFTSTSIYNEFKELLSEQNRNKVSMPVCVRICQYMTNIVATGLVLALVVAVNWGLWHMLEAETAWAGWELAVSALLTLVVTLCPLVFYGVVKLEYYTRRTAVYVTLARTWLLDMGALMLLLVYWSRSNTDCWETRFGQEAYRLVLLDAVVSLLVLPAIEFIRALIYKLNPDSSAPEFNIAYNSLTLIYNQGVLWFGLLFSPLLVVAVTIKFFILFYVKRECALRACQPARKVWRAAQTQTVLYVLVTLSLFATLFGLGSLFFRSSSKVCGPFRGYETVYSVLSEGALRLSEHPAAATILAFFGRPGPLAFILLFLCVSVYYMRARALAHSSMVVILRHMLVLQAKDKDFLLNAIAKVSNGEWSYSPKAAEGPDSHTWKYIRDVRKPSNSGFHFDASRLSHSFGDRPRSRVKEYRPYSHLTERSKSNDGDTDSSFSWQGSSSRLAQTEDDKRWP